MQGTITTLALASLLSVSTNGFWLNGSLAFSNFGEMIMTQNQLPEQVARGVRQALSEQLGIAPAELQIVLEGDEVVLGKLPVSVQKSVLEAAARISGLPTDAIDIVRATEKTWSNGCLELARPDELCTQVLVEGWQVTVDAGERQLIFHTNAAGSQVRLNERASQSSPRTNSIPVSELPPPLRENVILRTISLGGIEGRSYETLLTEDGQLYRRLTNRGGEVVMQQKLQLPPESVQEFERFLQQQDLASFHQLDVSPPLGSATVIRTTLTTAAGTVRYADFQYNQLPEPLQAVVQRWKDLLRMG